MSSSLSCSRCGAPLDSTGSCPRCEFAVALEPTEVGEFSAQAAEPIHKQFGGYEIMEEIGRGGMGIVYKARQAGLDRIVAVKMLVFGASTNPELIKRFRVEASAAGSLQHPNIVGIHEVGIHQGQHYFAMDFVEPESGRARCQSASARNTRRRVRPDHRRSHPLCPRTGASCTEISNRPMY